MIWFVPITAYFKGREAALFALLERKYNVPALVPFLPSHIAQQRTLASQAAVDAYARTIAGYSAAVKEHPQAPRERVSSRSPSPAPSPAEPSSTAACVPRHQRLRTPSKAGDKAEVYLPSGQSLHSPAGAQDPRSSQARHVAAAAALDTYIAHMSAGMGEHRGPHAGKGQPPNWVSDSKARACQICVKRFGMVSRRHHCRHCGRVVCSMCSPQEGWKPIPEFGLFEPVRHCIDCVALTSVPRKADSRAR